MTPRRSRPFIALAVYPCALLVGAGCDATPPKQTATSAASPPSLAPRWPQLDADDSTDHRMLVTASTERPLYDVASLSLGASVEEMPASPRSVIVRESSVVILDRLGRSVIEYTKRGAFLRRTGTVDGSRLQQPRRLLLWKDTVLVFDVSGKHRLSRLTSAGLTPWQDTLPPALDVAITGDGRVLLVQALVEKKSPAEGFITEASRLGSADARSFCAPAPVLRAAYGTGAALRLVQDTQIAILDSVIFCAQPTSGIVERFTLSGRRLPSYHRVIAPYEGLRQDSTADMRSIQAAQFAGTPIIALWPHRDGITQVYHDYRSSTANGRISLISSCDSVGGPLQCIHARTRDIVLGFSAPDTVWLFREPVDPSTTPPQLVAARLTRGR